MGLSPTCSTKIWNIKIKVGDTIEVHVYFGRYDCWEAWLSGVIEAINPNPPTDPKALKLWFQQENQYPGFWTKRKGKIYWVHIADSSVMEFSNSTFSCYETDVRYPIQKP